MLFKTKSFDELNTYELYSILQIRNEVFILEQNCFYQDLDNKDLQAIHLMGFQDDTLVAYCRLLPEGVSYDKLCSIGRVLTKSTVRGTDKGKQLMLKAIEVCRDKFSSDIRISAQSYLHKFYSDLGFAQVTEEYLEDGIPHFGMLYKW